MSTVVSRTISLRSKDESSTEHVGVYGTATSPMNLNLNTTIYGRLALNVQGASEGIYTLNDDGKAILFPNSVAKPVKADFYARMCARRDFSFGSATAAIKLKCNGTTVSTLSVTGSDLQDKNQSSITESALTAINKGGTVSIGLNGTDGKSSTQANVIRASITFYFTQYEFAVSSPGSDVSVSPTTGFDGDEIVYTARLEPGVSFEGWYDGKRLVSQSTRYTHIVNGSDLTLTPKFRSGTILRKFGAKYDGRIILNIDAYRQYSIVYNGQSIAQPGVGDRVTMNCAGKVMAGDVSYLNATLNCAGKLMKTDVVFQYQHLYKENQSLCKDEDGTDTCAGRCVTEYLSLPSGCTSLTIYHGFTDDSVACLHECNSGCIFQCSWTASSSQRTITLRYPDTTRNIRACFDLAHIEDCYIYDNTHGQYIFRGLNV